MFASAISKFHGVKANKPQPVVSAVAALTPSARANPTTPNTSAAPLAKSKPDRTVAVAASVKPRRPVAKPSEVALKPHAAPEPGIYVAGTGELIHAFTPGEQRQMQATLDEMRSGPFVDPNSVELELPESADPYGQEGSTARGTRNLKLKWVEEGYFDAGYEKLIGTFTDQVLRYGVRYGQDDLHLYARNSTLDTRGTGLPYPQVVTGLSVGLEARHWFPGNNSYAVGSIGDGLSGYDQGKTDVRYGLVGYWDWANNRWFSDFYGELFYIALATDTFFDWRLRSGRKWKVYKDKSYLWGYWVGQFWVSGKQESAPEDRVEFGPGIGYMFREAISINLEMRAGYAFEGGVDASNERIYWNPTLIIAGGWYKGWP